MGPTSTIELVADVEFFEQRVEQPTRPARGRVAPSASSRRTVVAVAFVASAAPGRAQASRCVTCGLVDRRRVDPSRMADTSGRAPGSGSEGGHLRDGLSRGAGEGRGVCRRPLCVEEAAGLRPSGE